MPILRVIKRDPSKINNQIDFNPSVFKYYVDRTEVKKESVKNGLKPAFFGMLDSLIRPDESNFVLEGDWSVSNLTTAETIIGGTTTIINNYQGWRYIYRDATSTMLTALIPANLNGYTGRTFKTEFNPATMGAMYIETTNLDEITHGELVQDGQDNQIVSIASIGGTPRISATFQTTNAGYGAIQSGEQGTHGIDEFNDYRPLAFWNETVTTTITLGAEEYYGKLTESHSGFTLDTNKILFATTPGGEALRRYNPTDLICFASLVKLHYEYRLGKPAEAEV